MAILGNLFVKLGLKNETFDKGIDESKKKVGGFAKSLKKVGGLIAGAFAIGAIKGFVTESVRLFNIQAQAENQLLVALKNRKDVQRDLLKQATELQGKTLFGDEETIQAQALIAAFVKEGDQIKKVIPLVQDLAAAKGMQLAVSADLVSKTLGSSTNALSRYGIEVTGAVGSVERLESLMKGLNDAFGGQAQAAAKVGTAALTQLSNAFGDLKEVLGELMIAQQNQEGSFTKMLTSASSAAAGFFKKVAGFSRVGLDFKTSLFASVFGSEEDFNMVENALNATSSAMEKTNKVANQYIETSKTLESASDSLFDSLNKSLIELSKTYEKAIEFFTKTPDVSGIIGGGGVFDMFGEEEELELPGFDTEARVKALEDTEAFLADLNSMMESGVEDFVSTFAEGLGRLASGDIGFQEFFNGILEAIGGFLGQMGKMLIAYGFAMEAFKKAFSNPFVAIAAGIALVAIGGAISGLASKGPSGAGGNVAYSGGGGGSSYGGSSSAQAQDNNFRFVLEGTTLVAAIDNTNRRRNTTR